VEETEARLALEVQVASLTADAEKNRREMVAMAEEFETAPQHQLHRAGRATEACTRAQLY
jgi:hypothetical protein